MKHTENDLTVALVGPPNVGKSTVFNSLTGLHQHTGNWTGKTVGAAVGYHEENGRRYRIIDLPGSYSLLAHSAEEEITRDFLCFESYDRVIAVCDATRLAGNLSLVLQILELTPHVTVVLNLMDEAGRRHIEIDGEALSRQLGVPVVMTSAVKKQGLHEILSAPPPNEPPYLLPYDSVIEEAAAMITPVLAGNERKKRFLALRLLEGAEGIREAFSTEDVEKHVSLARRYLAEKRGKNTDISMDFAPKIMEKAKEIASKALRSPQKPVRFSKFDRLLTSRGTGIPMMIFLVLGIFWLTAVGANVPSAWLSALLGSLETPLFALLQQLGVSLFWTELLALGVYRTLAWIVSVMLPPMLIFFPLFTFLEDLGYLPRIAFNLDGTFSRCGACGKQGLCMCMGLGCNAVGVTGARIIDSKRERLLAILTNAFMPCNGRYPAMIAVASVFFSALFLPNSLVTSGILTLCILLGVLMTFGVSWTLSHTLLKGTGSAFILELPPFRRPQVGKILIRSFLDRTVFVLFRAVTVAIPAGAIIYLLSHLMVGEMPVTAHISAFLDPLGEILGLDGVILLAFLLGLPANEIVLPLCLMLYSGGGVLTEVGSLSSLFTTLTANGWTAQTAICFLIFSVCHSPCATTLMTIKKETGKWRDALLAFLIPTVCGMGLCALTHMLFSCFAFS